MFPAILDSVLAEWLDSSLKESRNADDELSLYRAIERIFDFLEDTFDEVRKEGADRIDDVLLGTYTAAAVNHGNLLKVIMRHQIWRRSPTYLKPLLKLVLLNSQHKRSCGV